MPLTWRVLKWKCDYENITRPCIRVLNHTIEWINVSSLSKLTIYIYDIPAPITSDKILIITSGSHNSRYNIFYYVQNCLQVHPIHEVICRPYTVCNNTDTIVAPLKITSYWRLLKCRFNVEAFSGVPRGIQTLKESIIQKLSVFERKIFRPTKEANGIWRIKTNKEFDELIKHRNIINYVKSQRMSWFGHKNRMPETSKIKRIRKWKPFTGRPAGRPKSRCEDDVRNDLKKMKLMKWAEQVQDRLKWKDIVGKAKALSEL